MSPGRARAREGHGPEKGIRLWGMLTESAELPGVYLNTPKVFPDERGEFHEWFKSSPLAEQIGYPFMLAQANMSFSKQGVIRGLHFAEAPPGQAKYIICPQGKILDIIVDIRRGSETFGKYIAVELSAKNHAGVFIPIGFAHGFIALEDSTVCYLTSEEYQPEREHGINPFDLEIGVEWPEVAGSGAGGSEYVLSVKDREAPMLSELPDAVLPDYGECEEFHNSMRDGWVLVNEEASSEDPEYWDEA